MRHDSNFPNDVVALLGKCEPDEVYLLNPLKPHYREFLEFALEELRSLPFHNERGRTLILREDGDCIDMDSLI